MADIEHWWLLRYPDGSVAAASNQQDGAEAGHEARTAGAKAVKVVRAEDYERVMGAVDAVWLTSNEAFEIAYRGARACGVGKISPAQLTAALNALSGHLGGGCR